MNSIVKVQIPVSANSITKIPIVPGSRVVGVAEDCCGKWLLIEQPYGTPALRGVDYITVMVVLCGECYPELFEFVGSFSYGGDVFVVVKAMVIDSASLWSKMAL